MRDWFCNLLMVTGLVMCLYSMSGCAQNMTKGWVTSKCDGIEVTYRIAGDGKVWVDGIVDRTRGMTCTVNYSQGLGVFCYPILEPGE